MWVVDVYWNIENWSKFFAFSFHIENEKLTRIPNILTSDRKFLVDNSLVFWVDVHLEEIWVIFVKQAKKANCSSLLIPFKENFIENQ